MFNTISLYDPFKYENIANISIESDTEEPTCNYLFSGDLSVSINTSKLNLAIHNICSIPLHLDSWLVQCYTVTNNRFDVFGFCETRLNGIICQLYKIQGYNSYFTKRTLMVEVLPCICMIDFSLVYVLISLFSCHTWNPYFWISTILTSLLWVWCKDHQILILMIF